MRLPPPPPSGPAEPGCGERRIRPLGPGEALGLRTVFHSSVHQLAREAYTPEQRAAWAPEAFDAGAWIRDLEALRPWVVEVAGEVVAYGDLQPDGLIDHFYVAGSQGRKGHGSALLGHLLAEAQRLGLPEVRARVSLTAEPLFRKAGFLRTALHTFELRGVVLSNTTQVKRLAPQGT